MKLFIPPNIVVSIVFSPLSGLSVFDLSITAKTADAVCGLFKYYFILA